MRELQAMFLQRGLVRSDSGEEQSFCWEAGFVLYDGLSIARVYGHPMHFSPEAIICRLLLLLVSSKVNLVPPFLAF
jgi:hypothetical protein